MLKLRPRQFKVFLHGDPEGTYIGRTEKEVTCCGSTAKYLKIEDPKMLDSMHHKLFSSARSRREPFPKEEAIQNDIEDLSGSYPHLKGRRAEEYLDISLLRALEDEWFFKSSTINSRCGIADFETI